MSLYATIDDEDAGDIATSSGWTDFTNAVSLFDGVDELRQLTEYGWADDGELLAANITDVIYEGSLSPDQLSIAIGMLIVARKMTTGQVLTISDGVGVVESEAPA